MPRRSELPLSPSSSDFNCLAEFFRLCIEKDDERNLSIEADRAGRFGN